jgi:hypothetical protein
MSLQMYSGKQALLVDVTSPLLREEGKLIWLSIPKSLIKCALVSTSQGFPLNVACVPWICNGSRGQQEDCESRLRRKPFFLVNLEPLFNWDRWEKYSWSGWSQCSLFLLYSSLGSFVSAFQAITSYVIVFHREIQIKSLPMNLLPAQ